MVVQSARTRASRSVSRFTYCVGVGNSHVPSRRWAKALANDSAACHDERMFEIYSDAPSQCTIMWSSTIWLGRLRIL